MEEEEETTEPVPAPAIAIGRPPLPGLSFETQGSGVTDWAASFLAFCTCSNSCIHNGINGWSVSFVATGGSKGAGTGAVANKAPAEGKNWP